MIIYRFFLGFQGDQGPKAPNNLNPSSKMTLCFWTGAWVVASVSGSVAEKQQIHSQLKTPDMEGSRIPKIKQPFVL